jgi:hypothetical protein
VWGDLEANLQETMIVELAAMRIKPAIATLSEAKELTARQRDSSLCSE